VVTNGAILDEMVLVGALPRHDVVFEAPLSFDPLPRDARVLGRGE